MSGASTKVSNEAGLTPLAVTEDRSHRQLCKQAILKHLYEDLPPPPSPPQLATSRNKPEVKISEEAAQTATSKSTCFAVV